MAETLTAFLSIDDARGDAKGEALEEAFDDLDAQLMGVGEVVGWDLDASGVQLHVHADEPERVIPLLIAVLRTLDRVLPSKLVATDPDTGTTLYERSLA